MPRALIVGGSVGGLFAASLLRKIGWDVAVFEKSASDLSGRGAGLGLTRELMDVMRRAGAEIDDSIGVPCPWILRLDGDGNLLTRLHRPWTSGVWSRVYLALRAAVPDGIVFPGRTFESATQDEGGVTARFADGGTETGDLLVAADGVYSTVRRQFQPDAMPRYAGYVAWRCLIEERLMPPDAHALLSDALTYVFPPGEMSLSMPNPGRGDDVRPGQRGYYVIWYRHAEGDRLSELMTDEAGRDHGFTIPPPLIRKDVIADMRRAADALLPPMVAAVVAQTELPLLQAITDLEVPRMTFGRVALLGDAAFVARPHAAAGVSKAALDADTLAAELAASPGDIAGALGRYGEKRLAFGRGLVEYARKLGAAALADDDVRDPEQVMLDYGAGHLLHDVDRAPAAPS
jgi:2-polyprenyl-6-methoxyphenol hydroxylase-like FAD-dependent oxidoreductase